MKYVLVLILLAFSGCQLFESSETDNIDPNLLGNWYRIDTVSSSGVSPSNLRVRGWNVTTEGEMTNLGVVDTTGSIALLTSRYQPKILQAKNGKITVEYFLHPAGIAEEEVEYRFSSDQLIIENGFGFINGVFKKTYVGEKVIPSMPSHLQVKIDGTKAKNVNVSNRIPTAQISKTSESDLILTASLGSESVFIFIGNYKGPGTYTIGKEQAEYQISGTDWVQVLPTHLDSSGTITIDCNSTTSRCSGEFEFSTKDPENDIGIEPILEDGSFDVPIID